MLPRLLRVPLHLRSLPFRQLSTRASVRQEQQQPQYQAPTQQPPFRAPNPHSEVYKSGGIGRAVAYNFLIAMATFQVLYWSWLKLESIEVKKERQEELSDLEGELKGLTERGSKEDK